MKKIDITLAELQNVVKGLNNLVKVEIPAKYAYRFGKAAKYLQGELMLLRTSRDTLYKKYGYKNEEGNMTVPEDKREDFIKDFEDLLKEKISVEMEPMPLSAFGDAKMTTSDMAWLENFFIDDMEEIVEEDVISQKDAVVVDV